jgi:hypothetical protein
MCENLIGEDLVVVEWRVAHLFHLIDVKLDFASPLCNETKELTRHELQFFSYITNTTDKYV